MFFAGTAEFFQFQLNPLCGGVLGLVGVIVDILAHLAS
jgi:hypothetical protein